MASLGILTLICKIPGVFHKRLLAECIYTDVAMHLCDSRPLMLRTHMLLLEVLWA